MGFMDVANLRKRGQDDREFEPPGKTDSPSEERGETETEKAYEMRKAMEATRGGDTRKDKTRQ